MPDISIIIPAYQEQQAIGRVVEEVRRVLEQAGKDFEIIVVNDGSSDQTAAEAKKAGVLVFSRPYNIGNGAAVKTGIRQARGEVLVMMDGDGQHKPQDIPRLLEQMEHYDMAVGARTGGSETSLHRNLANMFYIRFATYVCKRRIEDLPSGFRLVRAGIAKSSSPCCPTPFPTPLH